MWASPQLEFFGCATSGPLALANLHSLHRIYFYKNVNFSRATSAGNIEAVIKLGISYLYNEGGIK